MEAVAEKMGVTAAGERFFFKKSSLRLAFLLRVEGLAFFLFFFGAKAKGAFCLVSKEKEKVELMVREKLISMPWLVSDWQKARHLMAREESVSLQSFWFTSESVNIWGDQMIAHASASKVQPA